MILSYAQSELIELHIVIYIIFFTLVCNVISVLVEMVVFAMVKVGSFRNIKLIVV